MKKSQVLKKEFDLFKSAVIAKNAPASQVAEMEKAFYAGVSVMFALNVEIAQDEISLEDSVKTIHGIKEELVCFANAQVRSDIFEA